MTEYLKQSRTLQRQKLLFVYGMVVLFMIGLAGRLLYLMVNRADYYGEKAKEVHQRQRTVKAARGIIYDRNGVAIASNKPVSTISVIHNQVQNPEKVIRVLSELLELPEEKVRKRVEKVSSIEKIKSNVDKDISDRIRDMELAGVMVDEDYKRYYPYSEFASKVIGFTGADNQGIIGMEVAYDKYLQGQDGSILTMTTARGLEIDGKAEERIEPIAGTNLYTSLDVNIQSFAQQAAGKVMKAKKAKSVRIVMMNPQNGEIYAMVNVPEYDLNYPFSLSAKKRKANSKKQQEYLNKKWRNSCLNDTYEPGSVFKIVTATAGLESSKVSVNDHFNCPGFRIEEDRKIRCHKVGGHGSETFKEGVRNSCNQVFMDVGARVGVDGRYQTFRQLGMIEKTGIDLPGEASSIMHQKKNVGADELATMYFGQSIQITPLQLLRAVSAVINGGQLIIPPFGRYVQKQDGTRLKAFFYSVKEGVIKKQTSETMKELLEAVVSDGSGRNCRMDGFSIGGKTATSEKLPRGNGKYISSFLGFAKADNPAIIGIVLIDEPHGTYYG